MTGACCSPDVGGNRRADGRMADSRPGSTTNMVLVEAGSFLMGNESELSYPDDGEGPVREAGTEAFWIGSCAVSNAEFERFVHETGHVTEAEDCGWSFVFAGLLPDDFEPTRGVAATPWWREVFGADWRHPDGPQSDLDGRGDHPVVHVTWFDAIAYCAWNGTRLPVEAEWERAARGGLERKLFPWGDELEPDGKHRMNVWQGHFPARNTLDDGWYGTCPVDAFEPNGLGLYNTTGNVWEWCADDFYAPGVAAEGRKVTKGGSYLCHASYCHRYRVAARSAITPDSMCGNVGFRAVRKDF